uniref:Uncharacterized protein n=1 Tax=Lepeophtheirus salmonis TaxID=72036 RepID=A0A0K2VAR2_LEPSM
MNVYILQYISNDSRSQNSLSQTLMGKGICTMAHYSMKGDDIYRMRHKEPLR